MNILENYPYFHIRALVTYLMKRCVMEINYTEQKLIVKLMFTQRFKSRGYGVSARALTPYPGDLNRCRICTPASEDELKESPKHVRQK
jgi:hypothetical protein